MFLQGFKSFYTVSIWLKLIRCINIINIIIMGYLLMYLIFTEFQVFWCLPVLFFFINLKSVIHQSFRFVWLSFLQFILLEFDCNWYCSFCCSYFIWRGFTLTQISRLLKIKNPSINFLPIKRMIKKNVECNEKK